MSCLSHQLHVSIVQGGGVTKLFYEESSLVRLLGNNVGFYAIECPLMFKALDITPSKVYVKLHKLISHICMVHKRRRRNIPTA